MGPECPKAVLELVERFEGIAERIRAAFPNSRVRVNAKPPYAHRTPDKAPN